MVVEYSTHSHHHPTENNVSSAGARNNEDSLAPFHKFALPRSLPRHISAGNRGLGYPPDQGTRTGRATRGLRAWLAVCRLAVRERIRRIAWSWWYARKASATEVSMNVAVVWPSAGADTTPSGMSLDQPLAARKPLTRCEKYGHAWSRWASSMVTSTPVSSHSTRPWSSPYSTKACFFARMRSRATASRHAP